MPHLFSARHGASLLAFGFSALLALPAIAQVNSEVVVRDHQPRTVAVKIHDLDLGSVRDRGTLLLRVNRAARAVCDMQHGSLFDRLPDARSCLREARAGALAQVPHFAQVASAQN